MKNIKYFLRVFGVILLLSGCQQEDSSFQMKETMRYTEEAEATTQEATEGLLGQAEQDSQNETEEQTTQEETTEQSTRQSTEQSKGDSGNGKDNKGDSKTTDKTGNNEDENGKKSDNGKKTVGEKGKKDKLEDVSGVDVEIDVEDENDEVVD